MVATFEPALSNVSWTPALVVSLPVVERNLQRLQEYSTTHRLQVRPHTKTHKSRYFAQLQLHAGATGLTAAKVGEAEVLADLNADLLIAYPAIDVARTKRLANLAKVSSVRVAVDSEKGVDSIAAAARSAGTEVGILVDLDIGFHRTGVQSPQAALELAQHISRQKSGVRMDGLFYFPGQIIKPPSAQGNDLASIEAILAETISLLKKSGISAEIISGGSTPAMLQSHLVPSLTEIRPGTYIFNDMNTVRGQFCTLEDVAAAVICTVVSTAVPGKAILDGGTKTFTSDRNVAAPDSGHGLVLEYPNAKLARLSEEHGELHFENNATRPNVGDRVTVIPNHICPCVNLQDRLWLQYADGTLTALAVDSRGRLC